MLSLKEMQSFRKVNHKEHGAGEKKTNFFNLGVKAIIANDCNHNNHHFCDRKMFIFIFKIYREIGGWGDL